MAELELLIEAGTIRWSVARAKATKYRLDELRRQVDQIIAQVENE